MAVDSYLPNVSGFYLGKVLKHCDNGKVKLWIPGIYDDKYKENYKKNDLWKELPDAVQISPLFGGCNNGNGMFSYPNIDSYVVCIFINKDQNYPAYFASLLNGFDLEQQHKSAVTQWNEIKLSTEQESHKHKINIGQNHIVFDENGTIQLKSQHNTDANYSSITLEKNGNITIDCTGNLTLKADNILLNAKSQIMNESSDNTTIAKLDTIACDSMNIMAIAGPVTICSATSPTGTVM